MLHNRIQAPRLGGSTEPHSDHSKGAKQLPYNQYMHRMEEGQCFYCGETFLQTVGVLPRI